MISHETNTSLRITLDQLKQELTYWVCLGVLAQSSGLLYKTVSLYVPRHQAMETEGDEGLQVQQKSGLAFAPRP
jgi:hypothetical protein